MKQNIDKQALDHIKVWDCSIEDVDGNPALHLRRKISQNKDEIVITRMYDHRTDEDSFRINSESAYILAAALQLIDPDE